MRQISISNIAWDTARDDAIGKLLNAESVALIDVAPTKYLAPADASVAEIESVRSHWLKRGVRILGMQSLLYGTTGFDLFGHATVQASMLEHLDAICNIGRILGARRLVFGSPRNRNAKLVSPAEVQPTAVDFFRRLGDIASRHHVIICIEPNPVAYDCNFGTTSKEVGELVTAIEHPAIRMQFDTGAVTMNSEDAEQILARFAGCIGHVHVSEPRLATLTDISSVPSTSTDHALIAAALDRYLPGMAVTIEMAASEPESQLDSVRQAIGVARRHYQRARP